MKAWTCTYAIDFSESRCNFALDLNVCKCGIGGWSGPVRRVESGVETRTFLAGSMADDEVDLAGRVQHWVSVRVDRLGGAGRARGKSSHLLPRVVFSHGSRGCRVERR